MSVASYIYAQHAENKDRTGICRGTNFFPIDIIELGIKKVSERSEKVSEK